jgi:hypothetical protein
MKLFYKKNSLLSKSNWVLDAFAASDSTSIKCYDEEEPNDIGVFWGLGGYNYHLIQKYKKLSIPFIFTDMPYWNRWNGSNKNTCNWRVIPNSLHCNWQGEFPDDRFKKSNIAIQEWKNNGDYILVCPSSVTMEAYYSQLNWIKTTIEQLKQYTDRPIKIRRKPRANGTSGPSVAEISFAEDCKNAWAVVTLCSIAGVEAAISGTPVFCHEESPCAPIGLSNLSMIEKPIKPERQLWLNTLSYFQYTENEISIGVYNEILK